MNSDQNVILRELWRGSELVPGGGMNSDQRE